MLPEAAQQTGNAFEKIPGAKEWIQSTPAIFYFDACGFKYNYVS
jgi:hypothetical protein